MDQSHGPRLHPLMNKALCREMLKMKFKTPVVHSFHPSSVHFCAPINM